MTNLVGMVVIIFLYRIIRLPIFWNKMKLLLLILLLIIMLYYIINYIYFIII